MTRMHEAGPGGETKRRRKGKSNAGSGMLLLTRESVSREKKTKAADEVQDFVTFQGGKGSSRILPLRLLEE